MSVHLRLGKLYLEQDAPDLAVAAYEKALADAGPDSIGDAWWGLGTARTRLGDRSGALAAFDEGLTARPANLALALEYVDALRATGLSGPALADRLQAHPARAASPYLRYSLSNALLASSPDAALAMRVEVLGLDPSVASRPWSVRPFERTLLHRLPAGDGAARVTPWPKPEPETASTPAPAGFRPPQGRPETGRSLLATVPEGLFLAGEGWIVDAAGRVHMDLHFDVPGQRHPFHFQVDAPGPAVPVLIPDSPIRVDGPALCLGGSRNYYHWMADFLPRLVAALDDPALRGLPILINADRTPFQDWWLAHLGVDPAQLVSLPYPGAARADSLVVPLLPPWTRIATMGRFRGTAGHGRHRLFVTRAAGHRHLAGQEILLERLIRRGYTPVDPGALAPGDQVALFRGAAGIVGPHGAGLANALLAPPEAPLVEILNPAWPQPFFQNLAVSGGRPYGRVDGRPTVDEARLPLFWDMVVSEREADVLEAVLNEQGASETQGSASQATPETTRGAGP